MYQFGGMQLELGIRESQKPVSPQAGPLSTGDNLVKLLTLVSRPADVL